jgi:hypothetical protein
MDRSQATVGRDLAGLFSELSGIPLPPPDKHEVLGMVTSICVHALALMSR